MDRAEGALLVAEKALSAFRALAPLVADMKASAPNASDLAQIMSCELAKALADLPKPRDGKDGQSIKGDAGRDGRDFDPEAMRAAVSAEVERVVKALPPAKDGQPGKDADYAAIKDAVDQAVKALPPAKDGRDGKDADPLAVKAEVERAVFALPKPKDGENGRDVDQAQAEALIEKRVAERVAELLPALVEKRVEARLQEIASEWQAKTALLVPPGRDGLPGIGRPGTPGEDGTNGRDGFGAEDIKLEAHGRTIVVSLCRGGGEVVNRQEIKLPILLDRGVFRSGQTYDAGDCVTYARHYWVAKSDTAESPGQGCTDWRLAVKGTRVHRPPSESRP